VDKETSAANIGEVELRISRVEVTREIPDGVNRVITGGVTEGKAHEKSKKAQPHRVGYVHRLQSYTNHDPSIHCD
jgi:hypothetical protein